MQVWNALSGWMDYRRALQGPGFEQKTIGFVPTMGALHRGHAALVERCRRENGIVVASIFVNPTQFNDPSDLARYPRTLDRDLLLLEKLGADHVLAPSARDLYPRGYAFRMECDDSYKIMEGASRPGFLQGVMTVVLKLLNIVRPHRAYFGEKDFQQLKVVREMAQDLFLPTEILACPTVREESGLAESSRNALLSAGDRKKAASLFRLLSAAATPSEARAALEAEGFAVDYVEEHWGRRFAAASLGRIRLIDNIPFAGQD
ncbi:MAG TPA: pantoate--beta-alanine ligase [Bryobacteraceae bacterium]|nr:pantoate--beta-alanine ligase [Bryobacteraceae bacterium]